MQPIFGLIRHFFTKIIQKHFLGRRFLQCGHMTWSSNIHWLLTCYQHKCCHVALATLEFRTHLHEAVELLATDGSHVILMPVWVKDDIMTSKYTLYSCMSRAFFSENTVIILCFGLYTFNVATQISTNKPDNLLFNKMCICCTTPTIG